MANADRALSKRATTTCQRHHDHRHRHHHITMGVKECFSLVAKQKLKRKRSGFYINLSHNRYRQRHHQPFQGTLLFAALPALLLVRCWHHCTLCACTQPLAPPTPLVGAAAAKRWCSIILFWLHLQHQGSVSLCCTVPCLRWRPLAHSICRLTNVWCRFFLVMTALFCSEVSLLSRTFPAHLSPSKRCFLEVLHPTICIPPQHALERAKPLRLPQGFKICFAFAVLLFPPFY